MRKRVWIALTVAVAIGLIARCVDLNYQTANEIDRVCRRIDDAIEKSYLSANPKLTADGFSGGFTQSGWQTKKGGTLFGDHVARRHVMYVESFQMEEDDWSTCVDIVVEYRIPKIIFRGSPRLKIAENNAPENALFVALLNAEIEKINVH